MATLTNSKFFSWNEFVGREKEISAAGQTIINKLDDLRNKYGKPIYPSPVIGALARFDGSKTSRHYSVGRQSDAIDVFIGGRDYLEFYHLLIAEGIGGIGIYPDTKFRNQPWPMFHIDLRPNTIPMIWSRTEFYTYPHKHQTDRLSFLSNLTDCVKRQSVIRLTDRE